jgi:hypothetical protein
VRYKSFAHGLQLLTVAIIFFSISFASANPTSLQLSMVQLTCHFVALLEQTKMPKAVNWKPEEKAALAKAKPL